MNEEQNTVENNDTLTPKQELFCQFYTKNTELFGNATLCYAEAYGYDLDTLDKLDEVVEFQTGETMTLADKEDLDFKGSLPKGKYRTIELSSYSKAYKLCSVCGMQNLRKPSIDKRIIELLNEVLTDVNIDAEITKVIKQDKDLGSKMRAINEYNKLRSRITEKKDITSGGEKIAGFNFLMPEETENKSLIPTVTLDEDNNTNNQTNEETSGSVESTGV